MVADNITLEAAPLLFVTYSKLHSRHPLESNGLFIDCKELTGDPYILALFVEMVDKLLNLLQWVLLLLPL
jgi:hypothetical protein